MTTSRVLVVDDDEAIRVMVQEGLQRDGFEVVAASNVSDALRHIATEKFDVLLSDLHMPLAGDGFTLVSAMRHTHPKALTVVLSGYPALSEAMATILSQADEILVKPFQIGSITELIRTRLADPRTVKRVKVESVATIFGTRERHYNSELAGPSGRGCGTNMYSAEPRRPHGTPP